MYGSPSAPFITADAVPLAHAYVHATASKAGVQVLSIKGPATEHHGLRAPRVSADADFLVDPAAFDRLLDELSGFGWSPRETSVVARSLPHHAMTLVRPDWPCDLDLHREFPGFMAPPADVFSALWDSRTELVCAGREILIPSRAGSILISTLHSMRSPTYRRESPVEIDALVERVLLDFDERSRAELRGLAEQTGAVDSTDDTLARLGVVSTNRVSTPALRAWLTRTEAHSVGTHFWLGAVRASGVRRWPAALAVAIWPSDEYIAANYPEAIGRRASRRVRWARLGRAVRDTPPIILAWLRVRSRRR